MVPSQAGARLFTYTPAQIASLESTISPERLASYLNQCSGDRRKAISLYENNTALSEALYGVLQAVEVSVRNAIHNQLRTGVGCHDWYDHLPWHPPEADSLRNAKRKLTSSQKPLTPGRIIAELSFGFWTNLLTKHYSSSLWIPFLHRAFPNVKLGRKHAFQRLDDIRRLRNRVAHHEAIINRDLSRDYREVLEVLGWICADTQLWLKETNNFEAVFLRCFEKPV